MRDAAFQIKETKITENISETKWEELNRFISDMDYNIQEVLREVKKLAYHREY